MSNTLITGNVSFVNHEKKYIIIEYEVHGKKKVVNGSTGDKLQKIKQAKSSTFDFNVKPVPK